MSRYTEHIRHLIKSHISGLVMSIVLAAVLVGFGIAEGNLLKVCVYLCTMAGCFLLSEYFYLRGNTPNSEWTVHQPKTESIVLIGVEAIALALMTYWFLFVDRETVTRGTMLTLMIFRVLFVFPVFLLVYFIAIKKYSLKELGILRFSNWYVSLPLIVLIGGVSFFLFPEDIQFESILKKNGYLAFLTLGFLTAAIPEEILRSLFQSRLGIWLNQKSFAWFLASLLWALSHIPTFTFNSGGDYYGATISALGILPIGLLWGYLNERYKSIVPAVLIHGTNLWGLHNIF